MQKTDISQIIENDSNIENVDKGSILSERRKSNNSNYSYFIKACKNNKKLDECQEQKKSDSKERVNQELSQKLKTEFLQCKMKLLDLKAKNDNKNCIALGIELYSMAKILTEIYDHDMSTYYEVVLLLICAYRKSGNYVVAEQHLLRLKMNLKKLIGYSISSNQELYSYYIMCIKEFVVLYSKKENFQMAVKYNELLLDKENTLFREEDLVELKVAQSMILRNYNKIDEAIELLSDLKDKHIENVSSHVCFNILLNLAKLYQEKGNIESAIYEINFMIDQVNKLGIHSEETHKLFLDTLTLKVAFLTNFLDTLDPNNEDIEFEEELKNINTEIAVSYDELTKTIFEKLVNSDYIENEGFYINSIHKHVLYLTRCKEYDLALSICHELLELEKKFFSNFNKFIGGTFELMGNVYLKKMKNVEALESYVSAFEIFSNLNIKKRANKLKTKIDKLKRDK